MQWVGVAGFGSVEAENRVYSFASEIREQATTGTKAETITWDTLRDKKIFR